MVLRAPSGMISECIAKSNHWALPGMASNQTKPQQTNKKNPKQKNRCGLEKFALQCRQPGFDLSIWYPKFLQEWSLSTVGCGPKPPNKKWIKNTKEGWVLWQCIWPLLNTEPGIAFGHCQEWDKNNPSSKGTVFLKGSVGHTQVGDSSKWGSAHLEAKKLSFRIWDMLPIAFSLWWRLHWSAQYSSTFQTGTW